MSTFQRPPFQRLSIIPTLPTQHDARRLADHDHRKQHKSNQRRIDMFSDHGSFCAVSGHYLTVPLHSVGVGAGDPRLVWLGVAEERRVGRCVGVCVGAWLGGRRGNLRRRGRSVASLDPQFSRALRLPWRPQTCHVPLSWGPRSAGTTHFGGVSHGGSGDCHCACHVYLALAQAPVALWRDVLWRITRSTRASCALTWREQAHCS